MSRIRSGGEKDKSSRQTGSSTQNPNAQLSGPASSVCSPKGRGPQHGSASFTAQHYGPLGPCLHAGCLHPPGPGHTRDPSVCSLTSASVLCSESSLHPPCSGDRGHRPTLLGCTARRRFSIHLSRSAADRQEKHLLPDDVVTCGGRAGQRHRGGEGSKAA